MGTRVDREVGDSVWTSSSSRNWGLERRKETMEGREKKKEGERMV